MNRRQFVVGAASLVFAPQALAKRSPVVLVTADLESRLVAVDLASGRVLRHIRTLDYPRSIETVGDRAVVAHSELGVVSVVRDFAVEHVVRGFGEPRYTAAALGRGTLTIADEAGRVIRSERVARSSHDACVV